MTRIGDTTRQVVHPAGHDEPLRAAAEDLQLGRWAATRALLADTWRRWPLWTVRTQVLASVAAHNDALAHWASEDPANAGLVTLRARAAVERALAGGSHAAGAPAAGKLELEARRLCLRSADAFTTDPVPWIGLLALAQLDLTGIREEHRVPAPDRMLGSGPWGLFAQARRRDRWNREAFHRMIRFWLARGDGAAATLFLERYLPRAPQGSPLHAIPLYLQVERYGRADHKEAIFLQWTDDSRVRTAVLNAYEHWLKAPGTKGRWPLVDESHLAYGLWVTRRPRQAAEVFEAMRPFVSSQPWASVSDQPGELLRRAVRQSYALG
ncbi:hypothetical protein [Streptomyces sp. NPDC089919]|uniref:hypothetical protein n=1 Tax=Streptomyces sp. NPDC089919 TaxID=3155188 RepID=UPI003419E8DB